MFKLIAKLGAMVLITLVLLESAAQFVWWRRDCVSVSGKDLCLLPDSLLSPAQLSSLQDLEQAEGRYYQFDPLLGWSVKPNSRTMEDGHLYASNDAGVRALRHYDEVAPPGVTRLAVFGPSFAHGSEVSNQDTWTYQMERGHPNLEVMNWGVDGYGTDQAFLRYKTQGAAYHPDVVIIVYEEENLRRNVNRFRPFYTDSTGIPLTKPVFVLTGDDELQMLDNPFPSVSALRQAALDNPNYFLDRVCPHDFFCVRERYQVSPFDIFKSCRFLRTLAFEVKHAGTLPDFSTPLLDAYKDQAQTETTVRLINLFVETVWHNGALPVVVTFPRRGTVEHYSAGEMPIYYEGVVQLQADGIHAFDLTPALVSANAGSSDFSRLFAPGGHYSEVGNQVVSAAILDYLCQESILTECPVGQ
jgi:hypothetical protein